MQKRFAVLGATGAQGGAVVTALLEGGAQVRGVTRRTDSPAARRLADAGAEVVAVAVIVDRATGAREAIEAQGLPYYAAYDVGELGLG